MADIGNDLFFATIPELNARLKSKEFSARNWRGPSPAGWCSLEGATTRWCFPCRSRLFARRGGGSRHQARAPARTAARDSIRREGPAEPGRAADHLGAKPYAGQVFNYNATVVDKLAGVGAVLAGKLSMVELAGGGGYRYASASLTGPGLNPWDRTRWSGGSSSGPAAAVAAGLVPFAIGSETSGSIVTPASYCGVTALRPTYGLVSRYGAMALSWTWISWARSRAAPKIAA